jgi:hypothetical protein
MRLPIARRSAPGGAVQVTRVLGPAGERCVAREPCIRGSAVGEGGTQRTCSPRLARARRAAARARATAIERRCRSSRAGAEHEDHDDRKQPSCEHAEVAAAFMPARRRRCEPGEGLRTRIAIRSLVTRATTRAPRGDQRSFLMTDSIRIRCVDSRPDACTLVAGQ